MGAGRDGPLMATFTAACEMCGGDATCLWSAGTSDRVEDEVFNARVSRSTRVIAYACQRHSEQVMNSLVEEFGGAANSYRPDELAQAVEDSMLARLRHP